MADLATMQTGIGLQSLTMDELSERATACLHDIEFSLNRALTDMFSLGEILVHVKGRSEHGRYGNFGGFVESLGVEQRFAQKCMQTYSRYNGKFELLSIVGSTSKLYEVLALPAGSEEEFFAKHDVASMTVRDVRESVKAVNHPEQDAHAVSDAAQIKEQKRADKELRDKIAQLEQQIDAANRRTETYKALLGESRENYERLEDELSSMKRQAESRGADQPTGKMTGGLFTSLVKRFVAECGEVALMNNAFYDMKKSERQAFADGIAILETFVRNTQNALIATDMEGVKVG